MPAKKRTKTADTAATPLASEAVLRALRSNLKLLGELAAEAGITAIVQPGGSIRDDEVIAAANQAGIAMVFTGVRHFRH